MANITRLIDANQRRWEAMHFKTPRIPEFEQVCRQLIAPARKAQYQEISKGVWGFPDRWAFVAVVDQREHDSDLGLCNSYLGNGQPLGQKTTIVPRNRGPFFNHPTDKPLQGAFYRGALDALIDVQHIKTWTDWSAGGTLTFLETLNGLGYADRGLASPYIWGGTSEQQPGKYVSDGVFDAGEMDTQLGCAGMLRYMMGLDPSITFGGAPQTTPVPVRPPIPQPKPQVPPMPTPQVPAVPNIGNIFMSLIPALLPIIPGILAATPLAPFVPIAQGVVNVVTKAQPLGGVTGAPHSSLLKLIADEAYAVAIIIDPSLPHNP